VGAYLDDTPAGANAGSAYVFDWTGAAWAQTAQLTASDASDGDSFGRNVALSGNNAIIGAFRHVTANGETGSAYVFNYSGGTWSQGAQPLAQFHVRLPQLHHNLRPAVLLHMRVPFQPLSRPELSLLLVQFRGEGP
jgi:hypothetical protein